MMETDGLTAVIQPLISALCPAYIEHPKEKISILTRKMLENELGDVQYVKIIDMFVLDGLEKDPAGGLAKLKSLHLKLGKLIDEVEK